MSIKNKLFCINRGSGFTLIEMAIVMVIIGVLIGAAILPLKAQRETAHINQTRNELKTIEEAIYGFAIANGRLPCPALPGGGGIEEPDGGGDCTGPNAAIGFVPSSTLGLTGNINCDDLLTDPWGNPYRYSVTTNSSGGTAEADFTTLGEIQVVGVATLSPNIRICTDSTCAQTLTASPPNPEAVAVIFSMGKNRNTVAGADETQNGGEGTKVSGCGLAAYGISTNRSYVSHTPVEAGANQFDDIMIWISPNILYAKLLAAGQL